MSKPHCVRKVGKFADMVVVFRSQYAPDVPSEWQSRSCAIVCVRMAFDSLGVQAPAVPELIAEGLVINAYDERNGWKHDGLVALAHNHGVPAYREEFKSIAVDVATKTVSEGLHAKDMEVYGLKKIASEITRGAIVCVSVTAGFGTNTDSHMIVISEVLANGIYYNDPAGKTPEEGEHQFTTTEHFLKHWKRLALFIG